MKLVQSINSACCFELVLGTQFDKKKVVNYKPGIS